MNHLEKRENHGEALQPISVWSSICKLLGHGMPQQKYMKPGIPTTVSLVFAKQPLFNLGFWTTKTSSTLHTEG